jgi:DNA-binding transcriptional ArsR family regulator
MPFGLVFPSFLALVLAIGLFGKIMAAGTGINVDNNTGRGYFDPRLNGCFGTWLAVPEVGVNRAKILDLISSRPSNPNQIASELKLDYKTIVHHLDVLSKNGLNITYNKESYGAIYFLTPYNIYKVK